MKDLLDLKLTGGDEWNWDYIKNLSEADFPIRSIEEFSLYLSQHTNGENFIVSSIDIFHPMQ